MTGDDSWIEERNRETAAGARRHYDQALPQPRSASAALRRYQTERARLDVLCGRRLIARVLTRDGHPSLELACEMLSPKNGGSDFMAFFLDAPISVACRCGARHVLDPVRLIEAVRLNPTHRREVAVAIVSSDAR